MPWEDGDSDAGRELDPPALELETHVETVEDSSSHGFGGGLVLQCLEHENELVTAVSGEGVDLTGERLDASGSFTKDAVTGYYRQFLGLFVIHFGTLKADNHRSYGATGVPATGRE